MSMTRGARGREAPGSVTSVSVRALNLDSVFLAFLLGTRKYIRAKCYDLLLNINQLEQPTGRPTRPLSFLSVTQGQPEGAGVSVTGEPGPLARDVARA